MDATIGEQRRVQRLHAPTAEIVPWVTYTYGFCAGATCRYTYLNRENAKLQTSVPAGAEGVDAMILWGNSRYDTNESTRIAAYLDVNMSVCV